MKKFYALVLNFVLISIQSTLAQDIGIVSVTPNQTEFKKGTVYKGSFEISVFATLPAQTAFKVLYQLDDDEPVIIQASTFDYTIYEGAHIPTFDFQFDIPDENFKLRVFTHMTVDTDHANDTMVRECYSRDKVANDLSVTIVDPVGITDQAIGSTADLVIKLKNEGTNSFNGSDDPLLHSISIDGYLIDPDEFNLEGVKLAPGDSFDMHWSFNFNESFLPKIYSFCYSFLWAEDKDGEVISTEGDTSDNTSCIKFNLIHTGIAERRTVRFKTSYANQVLHIEMENKSNVSHYRFDVLDITGKVVSSDQLGVKTGVKHKVHLCDVQSGLYLINVYGDGFYMGTKKILIR